MSSSMRVGVLLFVLCAAGFAVGQAPRFVVTGEVLDGDTARLMPGRVYIQSETGEYFFATPAVSTGTAFIYDRHNALNENAFEMHTTLSADLFTFEAPAGSYRITAERGKEYQSTSVLINVVDKPLNVRIKLPRWVDMADRGWYSGDTHVHRSLEELPNLQLAEDLHVAFPLTYWVTEAESTPATGARTLGIEFGPNERVQPVKVDKTHYFYPLNTEYEIGSVAGKRHNLGAFFALNHQQVLTGSAPPVSAIAREVHRQGGLLDLDKHDWPWALMLVPIMDVDLFELSNNHVWRTAFAFTKWNTPAPAYMNLPNDGVSGTELDWILYGLQAYYALLDCGFKLRPTAGSANGVHPVPLGFSRVYVKVDGAFSYKKWVAGLDAGRSFVTTGPMPIVTFGEALPGSEFTWDAPQPLVVEGEILSERLLKTIEIVVNGRVVETLAPENVPMRPAGFRSAVEVPVLLTESGWVALRCFEDHDEGKARFAHTGPVHVEIAGEPVRPRREEVAYLTAAIEAQIARSTDVLSQEDMAEYHRALAVYRKIGERAK